MLLGLSSLVSNDQKKMVIFDPPLENSRRCMEISSFLKNALSSETVHTEVRN